MPFTDAVSSVSGRNSRASNFSGMTGASHSVRSGPPAGAKSNDMFSNAGVLSMLKTSTDTGDIGALSFNQGRLPSLPRPAHQRRGHTARPSVSEIPRPSGSSHHYPAGTSSHHNYAPSQTSRLSDSTSFVRRGSFTSMQSMPPSLPPVNNGKAPLQMPAPTLDRARDSRSYSMTSAPTSGQLPRHRSATSLKSAGHEPRHGPRLNPNNVPPMPENRPPYVYPTRLKRPGYRSPSPALSDLSAQSQPMQHMMHGQRRHMMPMPMQRPQLQTYNSDFGGAAPLGAQYLNVQPPPRNMNTSPVMGYEQPQFTYRPGAMRSDPGVHMGPMPHQQPLRQAHHGPPPVRAGYPGQPYGPPRPGYAAYPPMQHPSYIHPAHRGQPGVPSMAPMAPMAHSIFHNAARMARHLPQRTDTPMTESGPPSSDPPSSGTAPSSSSPPTPKDQTTIHVAVDPLFIDPTLTDLPDSSSEPVLPHKYFEYADGLDKAMDETEIEVPHPSVPPTGFVQRVRAMLESRAAVEAAAKKEAEREKAAAGQHVGHLAALQVQYDDTTDITELVELAANETPRFTIIEEFQAPVELPASPVKVAELSNSPPRPKEEHRLTREMIKAELVTTSGIEESTFTDGDAAGASELDLNTDLKRQASKQTASSRSTDTSKNADVSKPSVQDFLDTPGAQHKRSVSASAATASPEIISGIDYALRFSVPIDTTTATDETQSRDPFMLDADTITLQHQRSKETAPQPRDDELPEPSNERPRSEVPVSPLQPDEDVSRCSAVSPLQTQTLGIDETMRVGGSNVRLSQPHVSDTSSLDVATSTDDVLPPPTPRTPRIYSKSVQLPQPSITASETPSTNRFSLPPDLSTVADTTMNTNSDMITDVAVRFSLPNTTITIGKPQIVTIPPSSSPDKPVSPPPKSKLRGLEPKSARRSSVTFADEVAPLNVRKTDPRREGNAYEPPVNTSRSIMRRPSPMDESTESSHGSSSRESTLDLRFGSGHGLNGRFGSTHLPGLKEESIEDMSISEHQKRSSSRNDSQQLALPARIAAVKAMQERRIQESADKAKARRAARHHNRTLAEIRDLPSLNFSRMDLIDKLNEALEIRPSKSLEVVRRRDFSAIYCPSPQRPQSTEPLRERYTSFFSKPEDFSSFFEKQEEDDEAEGDVTCNDDIPKVEIQESTKLDIESDRGSRPLSPEDFLSVANQVNRLSIPSVTGLSEKLTNLLPALRDLKLDSILASDDEVAHTIDDIHHIGGFAGRPDTVLSTRTSAGFRTLAERAEEIVQNGTHDSMAPPMKLLTDKELPPLPESASADKVSAVNSSDGKQSYLSGSVSAPSDLCQPARPPSALLRAKTPLTEDEVRQLLPPEMNPITRSKRSLILSSASRPWNQDENYPWNGTNVPVDLSIPSEAHTRSSTTGDLHRISKSLDISSSAEATDTTRGIDIGSILAAGDSTASITTEQATGIPTQHLRKHSKRSIIGSITKKISLTAHANTKRHAITSTIDDTTRTSVPSPALGSDSSQPHKPGDRYPTTALTPPVNLQLDEVRSFFSDNSSEKQRQQGQITAASFRKRFTAFNKPKKPVRLDATRGTASLDGHTTSYDAGSLNAQREGERVGVRSAGSAYEGVGMGKAEFRIKRFGEKLRHLFAKGGSC